MIKTLTLDAYASAGVGVLAVQFHPEKLLRQGEEQWLSLFEYYVSLCK